MQSIRMIIEEYKKTRDFKALAENAKKLLKESGFSQLPTGSYWKWMHIEWLNKGLGEKALAENTYGQFVPIADVLKTTEVVGQRGRESITKEIETLSLLRFLDFANRYNKFCYAQEMESQRTMSLNDVAM